MIHYNLIVYMKASKLTLCTRRPKGPTKQCVCLLQEWLVEVYSGFLQSSLEMARGLLDPHPLFSSS